VQYFIVHGCNKHHQNKNNDKLRDPSFNKGVMIKLRRAKEWGITILGING
jgi:hypothetical protein